MFLHIMHVNVYVDFKSILYIMSINKLHSSEGTS